MRVVIPSTAAQYFHLLRSQALLAHQTPLIVVTPKSLLRSPASRSSLDELTTGAFTEVLDDGSVADPLGVHRVVLASGKVAFEAMERRAERIGTGVPGAAPAPEAIAIVRVEQLYPWPEGSIEGALDRYPNASEVIWLQEEPENMGAWSFVHNRLHRILRERYRLVHVSRPESASPATGSAAQHQLEQADLLDRAIG